MTKQDEQKPMGIIIRRAADVEKFTSLEDCILESFYGRDLTETMENTSLEYFHDRDVAEEIYDIFKDEIHERVSYESVHDVLRDKIANGTIDEEDYSYYFKVQMTIDAVSEICAEHYFDHEKVDANPDKLIKDIFKENNAENEKGGR